MTGSAPSRPAGLLVADLDDQLILARLAPLATKHGLDLVRMADLIDNAAGAKPVAIVVDVGSPGAIDRITAYRGRWPSTLLAGSIAFPDQERWHGALAAGADLVASRGAFAAQLARALEGRSGTASSAAVTRPGWRRAGRTVAGRPGWLDRRPADRRSAPRHSGRVPACRGIPGGRHARGNHHHLPASRQPVRRDDGRPRAGPIRLPDPHLPRRVRWRRDLRGRADIAGPDGPEAPLRVLRHAARCPNGRCAHREIGGTLVRIGLPGTRQRGRAPRWRPA